MTFVSQEDENGNCPTCHRSMRLSPVLESELCEAVEFTPAAEMQYIYWICQKAGAEMSKAKVKFPQPNYVTLKVAEEAGEVVRGAVHYAEGRLSWAELEGEAIQAIAMLLRLLTEGDEINGVIPPAFRLEELKGA